MDAKERILTIRLMEKLWAYPAYARALGMEVRQMQAVDDTQSSCRTEGAEKDHV